MFWFGVYLAVAGFVGVTAFLAAEWFRPEHSPAPERPGSVSMAAGVLWPAVVLGVAELGLICWLGRGARRSAEPEPQLIRVA